MKHAKKILGFALVVVMAVSMFAGCGEETTTTSEKKLTYWLGNSVSTYVSDYNDAVALQKMQENVGIEVEFIHPSSAAWEEQFNIMIASNDLTDLIYYDWGPKYNGGFEAAFNDGLIIDLTDKIDKMPNFKKILEENPDHARSIKTTDGKHLFISGITNDIVTNSNQGPMIRKDWLDKLGLEIPKTIEDWYNVLKAFKTKDPNGNGKADEIPFAAYKSPGFSNFVAAYGIRGGVFVKDGKVVHGAVLPEYKEYLTEMNKWYKEGLIDNEYAALEKTVADAYMTNDISGATVAFVGGGMGNYLAARQNDPEYNLVAAPWPSKTADTPNYIPLNLNRKGNNTIGTVITTKCKDIDLALEFLDYSFSDEATDLQNWGIEGKTYTVTDGKKKFTDFVMNNPEGLSAVEAITPYAFTAYAVPPRITDAEAYSQIQFSKPQQREASVIWAQGDDSLMTQSWPLTAEEKSKLAKISTDMNTYISEMTTKMIMGMEPISKFDEYVAEVKTFGLDEVLAIYQTAYERFMAN